LMNSSQKNGGLALLATETGGVDTIPVTQEEGATLGLYLQQLEKKL